MRYDCQVKQNFRRLSTIIHSGDYTNDIFKAFVPPTEWKEAPILGERALYYEIEWEIIWKSGFAYHPHDQKQWNELKVHELFLGKDYGVLGDGGFTFNLKNAHDHIKGYTHSSKEKEK